MKWLDGYRMRLMFASFIMAIAVGGIGPANGATVTVGSGAGYDFNGIQAGIDAANDGDEVLVAPGEYVITVPITFRGKAITVRSEAGRDETTIRMGTLADPERGSVVVFENNETVESVLDGFTITGGSGCRLWIPEESEFDWAGGGIGFNASSGTVSNCAIVQNRAEDSGGGVSLGWGSSAILTDCIIDRNVATEKLGGGVCCVYGSSVTMTDCAITGNSAGESGGGVFCYDNSSLAMTNCIIRGNSATELHGGGVFCYLGSSSTMTDCTIAENSARGSSGGVCCWDNSPMTLTNCTIVQNSAARDGGLCSGLYSPTVVINCTIWGNSGGTHGGGLSCYGGTSATVTNSILWGNTSATGIGDEIYLEQYPMMPPPVFSITYSNVAGGQAGVYVQGGSTLNWGKGNIDTDPCFADPSGGDFHLKSEAGRWDPNSQSWVQDEVTSPCIDWGDRNSDCSTELWPHGTRVNMGAYGGTPQASMSTSDAGNIADLNADNSVNFRDYAGLVGIWQVEGLLIPQDLDRDGTVGYNDLAILADNWLAVVIPLPLAHWKLDETEGSVAHDSVGDKNGTVAGAIWQPTGGKVNGAIEFDGEYDLVTTPFVLNPADGAFSVFAWIKGGAPGQVIISQADGTGQGSAWLCAEPPNGKLTTTLMNPPFPPLESESVITDSQWHHIGLVYDIDVLRRYLYVDGVEVAKDNTIAVGVPSTGGLYFGAGKDLEEGCFFSGLIDDVRIYKVALSAEEIEELAR
ncbi:MAG: right-handed parallel beta-helix repeat-containing protein [Planctomycetota bacterium]